MLAGKWCLKLTANELCNEQKHCTCEFIVPSAPVYPLVLQKAVSSREFGLEINGDCWIPLNVRKHQPKSSFVYLFGYVAKH